MDGTAQASRRPFVAASLDACRRLWAFVSTAGWRFYRDECLTRAAALAYTTLLSLVPLLALMFAVLKGLGVQQRLEPLLLSRFGLHPDTVAYVIHYIDQTNVATLGALGAAALILTVVSVLGSIEATLNTIWHVSHGRTYWRKLTDYSGVVLLTPLLLLAAVAVTSSMQEHTILRLLLQSDYTSRAAIIGLRVLPILINAVALAILYAVMPNRRPCLPAIALGALCAGALWFLVQWAYVALQIGMARYNAIYGALSQLPITLVWLYVSAVMVLVGAELAATYEFGAAAAGTAAHTGARWLIGAHALLRAAERFQGAGGTIEARVLARELRVPVEAVLDVLDALTRQGALAAVAHPPSTYVLARDPGAIDLTALDLLGPAAAQPPGCDPRVIAFADRLTEERRRTHAALRLADILYPTGTGAPVRPAANRQAS
jgi:membrane protein